MLKIFLYGYIYIKFCLNLQFTSIWKKLDSLYIQFTELVLFKKVLKASIIS